MRSTRAQTALALVLSIWFTAVAATAATSACVQAAPRVLLLEQREQLCHLAHATSTAPARCATAALRATNAFPAAAKQQQRADMLTSLCARAKDTGPALCWLAFPFAMRQQLDMVPALLRICNDAVDTQGAECFVKWRKFTAFSSKRTVLDAARSVAELCRSFRGDNDALVACAQQAPHTLGPVLRFQMCQHATSIDKIPAIRVCASELLSDNVPHESIARVCALATQQASPRACVRAATRQLRWMGVESRTHLCEGAFSAEPVHCAVALRRAFPSSLHIARHETHDAQLLAHAAVLCHSTQNASVVVACVTKAPAHALSLQQLTHLCAHAESSSNNSSRDFEAPLYASQCIASAKRLLGTTTSVERVTSETANLLYDLCADATSSAPIDCLAAVQHDQTLSTPQLRVALCRKAQSSSPRECYSKLRPLVNAMKLALDDALALCSQVQSFAPALCVTELAKVVSTVFMERHAAHLCANATSAAPVRCFRDAPSAFGDHDKRVLCQFADSDAPAVCARNPITRLPTALDKAELCHRAESVAPAACAMLAPFGMKAIDIIALCRGAMTDMPARCARAAAVSSLVSHEIVTALCANAHTLTPASCLLHHIRQRRDITQTLVSACRRAVPVPAALEIAQVMYECPQLVPHCRVTIHLRVHDQFGDEMPQWSSGYLYIDAAPADGTILETTSPERVLLGPSHAPITNGSVVFHNVSFAEAGEFVVTIKPSSHAATTQTMVAMNEKVARIRIYEDVHARRRARHCDALFKEHFACSADLTTTASIQHRNDSSSSPSESSCLLELSAQRLFDVLECESHWREHTGGLRLLGATGTRFVFAIHRAAYRFLTYVQALQRIALYMNGANLDATCTNSLCVHVAET